MDSKPSRSTVNGRRRPLMASVATLGLVGAFVAGATLTEGRYAWADPVKVEAAAPADFAALVSDVGPAVVSVQVKSKLSPVANREFGPENMPDEFQRFFRRFGQPRDPEPRRPRRFGSGQGSGFFISEDGYIVTNHHVIDDAEEVTIILNDGTEYEAAVIGSDERTDLALLKVEGNDFTYVGFADDMPPVGQWVVAVGNPFGLGGTVTAGIVSAHGRDIGNGPYDDFLQIDAPVNRGNSGGPAFNTQGEVVGVNTAIFSPSGGNVGIAFAIPASTVETVINELRDDGTITRGWLGVQIQGLTDDIAESMGLASTDGALVTEPQAESPAVTAGIKAGDLITEVDGETVQSPRALARMIADQDPDSTITLTILRDGNEMKVEVTLGTLRRQASQSGSGESPADESYNQLGLALEINKDGEGVKVAAIDADSAAAEKGLQSGDIILSVGGEQVASLDEVDAQIGKAEESGRAAVLLRVQNERGMRFVALPLQKG